jgi:hypothetical protein
VSETLPSAGHVIYEVNLDADAAIEGPFDTWLRDHIADMLQLPGFLSAEILSPGDAPPGRIRRTVQYRLRDQAALDDYLRRHAPEMRSRGLELFGERFSTDRRVLAHREEFIRGAVSTENCLNCGEVLTGQHCSHCGQRAKVRVLSLWSLLKDVLGDAFDWDSRIWRTLRPLAFRPGLLTQEFLRGRRASYTPPFRMYLIVSVAFFLLATLGNDPGSSIKFQLDDNGAANLQIADGGATPKAPAAGTTGAEAETVPDAAKKTPSAGAAPQAADAAAKPAPQLDAEALQLIENIVKRMPEKDRDKARKEFREKLAQVSPEDLAPVKKLLNDPCSSENLKIQIGPLGDKYGPRLREACRKIATDTPTFGRALFANIPKMMFIFLPLIAVVMYVLYLGSGRYYVEHLLFFVHFHAFFFLGGTVILLLEDLATMTKATAAGPAFKFAANLCIAAFTVYVPVYLYLGMRRVYGQGRVFTLAKYAVLGIAYIFCLTLTGLGLLFYTALTL